MNTEFVEFQKQLADINCYKCKTHFTIDTIMLSIFFNGNYYCEKCGKTIIERWKADQILTSNQADMEKFYDFSQKQEL